MKRTILATLLYTVSLSLSYGQNTIGTLRNDSGAFAGYTLFSPNFSTQTYLINNCGEVVNEWTSAYRPGVALYLLDNGNLLRTGGHENPELVVGAALLSNCPNHRI